jgi:hypothetical protein
LNPFLLVGDSNCGSKEWNKSLVTEEMVRKPGFPTYCAPRNLIWSPKESKAEVTYDASIYLANFARLNRTPVSPRGRIQLEAINARDLGLNFICLDLPQSLNIQVDTEPLPIQINQFIHCGGTCGYPGGCNNMSPYTEQLDTIRFTDLPARVVLFLWRSQPRNAAVKPDMTFTINYR